MAKRKSVDFSRLGETSWGRKLRDDYTRQQEAESNRASELSAILTELEKEGLTEEQLGNIAQQFMETGRFDVSAPQSLEEAAVPPPSAFVDYSDPEVRKNMPQMSAMEGSLYDHLPIRSVNDWLKDTVARADAGLHTGFAGVVAAPGNLYNLSSSSPIGGVGVARRLGVPLPKRVDWGRDTADDLMEKAGVARSRLSEQSKAGSSAFEDVEGFFPSLAFLATNPGVMSDLLAEQAGQLVTSAYAPGSKGVVLSQAGMAGSMAADEAEQRVLAKGGTKEQAEAARDFSFAVAAGANTALPYIVPKGTSVEKMLKGELADAAGNVLKQRIGTATGGAAAVLAGESTSEALAETLEAWGVNVASGDPWDQGLGKAAAVGGGLGLAMGSAPAASTYASRKAGRATRKDEASDDSQINALQERIRNLGEGNPNAIDPGTVAEQEADFSGESQLDTLRRQGAERRKQAEIDAAYAQREAERQAVREQELNIDEEIAATQKEVEEEAGFRTIERDAAAPTDRVERLPDGTVERVPVQPAAPITAEQVVAEQELSALERRAKEQENEKLRRRSVLEGRLSAREKKAADAEQKQSNAELKARVVREQQIADSVLDDMPNATPNEIEAEFNRRLNEPVAPVVEAPVVSETQKRVEEKLKKEQAAEKAKQTRTTTARRDAAIAAARRENPEATPAEIAAIADAKLAGTEETAAPVANEDARERARQMGLGMAGQEAAAHSGLPESDVEGLRRIGEAGRAIAARQTKESVGVENLLAQGKLVITTNGEFVGRGNTGRAGEYDPNTNRMYIYLDNLGDKDIVQGILEEIGTHESIHLGSFNSREGRSAVMSALMGDGDVAGAAQRIRDAAANGNTIAKDALSRIPEAERAGVVGDLELLAYFTNAVRANRQGTLGSLRGVASDMVASARSVLRDRVGLDLDISINDLANAVSDVTTEAARTDTSGPINTVDGFNNQPLDTNLGMVLTTTAREFPEQEARGRTYVGSKDGKKRFVISDKDALTTRDPETIAALLNGEEVLLGEVLQHQRLYDNLPWMMEGITVRIDPSLRSAQYEPTLDPRRGTIALPRRDAVQLDTPDVRNTILHEVQHGVQTEGGLASGANVERFIPTRIKSEMRSADRKLDETISKFDLGAALTSIPPALRREVEGVFSERNMSLPEKQEYVLRTGLAADSPNRVISAFARNIYDKVRAERNEVASRYKAAERKAVEAYAKAYGEAESRTVEQTSNLSQEELDAKPFEEFFGEGQYFPGVDSVYDVKVEDTINVDSLRYGTLPPELQSRPPSLGMASPVGTPAFDSWFGNSVVTNEDGSPRTVYTGTSKDTDFKSFKMPKNGVWFSADPKVASDYARDNDSMGARYESGRGFVDTNTASRVFPVYLSIQNPYTPTDADLAAMNVQNYKRAQGVLFDRLRTEGYDGVDFGDGTYVVIGQPSQIKSVNNSGQFSPRNKDVLGMASPASMAKRAVASVRAIVDTKSDKERLYRLLSHQRNTHTADIAGAESVFSQLRQVRAASGDVVAFDAAMTKALDGNMTPAEKAAFEKDMPEAAAIVKDFREQADNNAKAAVSDILRGAELNNRDLTAEENSLINTLLDNLGEYVHRAYSTLQGGEVGALARKERLEALDLLRAGAKDVPRRLRSDYTAVVNAADYLAERLVIPPTAEMEMSKMDSISTLYDTWVGDSSKVPYDKEGGSQAKKDAMIEALENMRDRIGEGVLNEKAYEAIETLMGVHDNSPYGKVSRGALSDTGVMKRRNQIPPVIRELLGEFTDPSSRILTTLAEQSGWLARQKMLTELASESNGILVASPQYVAENGRGEFTKKLDSSYGAVAGWYATPETFDAITDLTKLNMAWREALSAFRHDPYLLGGKVLKTAGQAGAYVTRKHKALRIKWNPWAWARDIVGSPLFLIQNGNFHVSSYAKGVAGAKDYIASASSSRITPTLDEIIRHVGVESARIGEIQHIFGEDLTSILRGLDGDSSMVKEIWNKIDRTTSSGKAMTDNWTRIANFYARLSDLQEFHELAGIPMTREQLLRKAGEDTDYTNVSYGRIANIAAGLEKGGFSTYLPFNMEIYRTAVANYAQAYADVMRATDPTLPKAAASKMLRMGVNRAIGNTMALSSRAVFVAADKAVKLGLGALGIKYALQFALNGLGDEDEEDKWRRRLLSDMNTHQDLRYTGVNEDGMPTYMPFGQLDPHGPMTDVLRTAMTTPGTPQERAEAVGKQMLELYITPSWPGRIYRAITGSEPEAAVSRTFPDAYKAFEKMGTTLGATPSQIQRGAFAAETFLPGFVSAWDPKAAPGDEANLADRTLNKMGLRYEQLRPEAKLASWAYDTKNERTANHQELNSLIANQPELSETVLKRALVDFQQNEMGRLREVWKTRRTLEAWGIEEGQIKAMMKDAKFSERDIKSIYSDDPKAVISVQALERYVTGKNDGATRSTAREETYKENLRKLKASREWLASLGIELEN